MKACDRSPADTHDDVDTDGVQLNSGKTRPTAPPDSDGEDADGKMDYPRGLVVGGDTLMVSPRKESPFWLMSQAVVNIVIIY